MADRKYSVVKEFKYAGKILKPAHVDENGKKVPGDTWQPTPEGLYDDRKMSTEPMVQTLLPAAEKNEAATTKEERNEMMRRKKVNKGGKKADNPKKKQTAKPKAKEKAKKV